MESAKAVAAASIESDSEPIACDMEGIGVVVAATDDSGVMESCGWRVGVLEPTSSGSGAKWGSPVSRQTTQTIRSP